MNDSSLWIILQRMRLPFVVILVTYTIAMTGMLIIPGIDNDGNIYHMTIFESFYFVTYTATTIGFGEFPYPFTYYQKIWVSISIYTTVIGWFYGIGALVTLLQDKVFISEIAIARFQRSVKNIKEDFVIVLGYNETTSEIIKRILASKMRVVVIEKDEKRADYLLLEGFVPRVPILIKDAHNAMALEQAGIQYPNCKGIVSVFKNNVLNLRITLSSKLLNPNINVIVKSTTEDESKNLIDAGANVVDNPFLIIAEQLEMALKAPSLLTLENWLYHTDSLDTNLFKIPNSDILICGFGRLGSSLDQMFKANDISPTIIEIDEDKVAQARSKGFTNVIGGNADDHDCLKQINIANMKLVIIATDDDTTNLSILSTVKRFNEKAIIIARENDITDFSIFSHAKIDHLYIPDQILTHKTTNAISNPLGDKLIRIITKKDEEWGSKLLERLIHIIGNNPLTYELEINNEEAYAVCKHLNNSTQSIPLDMLLRSREDRLLYNNIIVLFIQRKNSEILLPNKDVVLERGDKILFACDDNSKTDIEYICNNAYEFEYILAGIEKENFKWLRSLFIKNK